MVDAKAARVLFRALNPSMVPAHVEQEAAEVPEGGVDPATGKVVMWVRGTGEGNTPQLLAVATADAPTGPFTFEGHVTDPFHTLPRACPAGPGRCGNIDSGGRGDGYQYADATLFTDPCDRSRSHDFGCAIDTRRCRSVP